MNFIIENAIFLKMLQFFHMQNIVVILRSVDIKILLFLFLDSLYKNVITSLLENLNNFTIVWFSPTVPNFLESADR